MNPLEPLEALMKDFLARRGTHRACTPCVQSRRDTQKDLIDGAVITGANPVHELINEDAATLSFLDTRSVESDLRVGGESC